MCPISDRNDEKICGVNKTIIEHFLSLIREKYPEVDKANFFLELHVHTSGINIAIANQRDTLSHLVSILSRTDMADQEILTQLSHAEEHLRRAMVESYSTAVNIMFQKVLGLYESYKSTVLPLLGKSRPPSLEAAPDLDSLETVLDSVNRLRTHAREEKSKNSWESAENATKKLLEAFLKLKSTVSLIEKYISIAMQHRENRRTRLLTIWSIIATVSAIILAILFFVFR